MNQVILGVQNYEEQTIYYSASMKEKKRKLQMLPIGFVSPRETFKKQWPSLYKSVLKSYDYHDIVNIIFCNIKSCLRST